MATTADPSTAQAVTVADRRTGELLDLATAGTDRLADVMAQIADLRAELAAAERAVSAELVARLDRDCLWTQRVGDPTGDVQYEIRAPSPAAGGTVFDEAPLEQELAALIKRGTISAEAASGALKRTVTVTFTVPFGESLEAIEDQARADDRRPAVSSSRIAVVAGIRKLEKVGGTAAALKRASRVVAPPERRAKVTVKTKARRS